MAIKAIVENLDEVPAQFHELYTQVDGKYTLTGVEGMKPLDEFNRVHGGLVKERNDHKTTKGKLDAWALHGTPEEVQLKLDRIAELETAAGGKLDEAAISKLVETRIGTKLAPVQRELQTALTQVGERDQIIAGYKTKERTRTIHDTLRESLKKQEGFQASAFDDAAMLAERVFDVDEEGRVTAKEGVGCTPGIDPATWLTEMQSKRPHWWGPSSGGGSKGSGFGTSGTNPFTHEGWNMTEQGRMITENRARAEQMARSAGTTIGGAKPAARQ
jgi:hypothetical protein